ncbi:MAG: 30S ribosomal protein S6 [Tepidanaerobacteraceae bacterium]|nr:30S ribosomal protein S6 [Tepidanaerobacter sp.]HQA59946.1 30S ribosomal protein S6 [Tepidanaerobacteraceae bacterium]
MRKYETIFIVDPNFEADQVNELVEKFKGLIQEQGGQIDGVDDWGKRRLAYPINKQREGYYFLINFTAKPETAQDLERVYKITNGVLRYLIVKNEK